MTTELKPEKEALHATDLLFNQWDSSTYPQALARTKSVGTIPQGHNKKVTTKTQGGGFNRSHNSGYFKNKSKSGVHLGLITS